MSDTKMVEIAKRLLKLSQQGKITWSASANENKFFVAFPDYSVSIQRDPYAPSYVMTVHNHLGTGIEFLKGSRKDESNYQILSELFGVALRVALESDKLLDEILERLSKEDVPR
jgi:hypothetical protein